MADLNGHEGGNAGNGQGAPKGPGEGDGALTEGMEGRGWAKGNAGLQNTPRAQNRESVSSAWDRIRQAAGTDKGRRFTTLLHHVYKLETLSEAYFSLKREAAPGVDGETWQSYGEQLEQQPQRPLRSPATRSVPSEAGPAGIHSEAGRTSAATRGHHARGQGGPACPRDGPELHLRGRLPRLFLRIPARAQTRMTHSTRSVSGSSGEG